MTVRELRELLFKIEDQEQEVKISIGKLGVWSIEEIEKSWDTFNGDMIIIKPVNENLIKNL